MANWDTDAATPQLQPTWLASTQRHPWLIASKAVLVVFCACPSREVKSRQESQKQN
jgi:hypothetical protein